jgi:hypothetical protein
MENEYNTNFDKGTFSRAIKVKSMILKKIHQELSKLLISSIKLYAID